MAFPVGTELGIAGRTSVKSARRERAEQKNPDGLLAARGCFSVNPFFERNVHNAKSSELVRSDTTRCAQTQGRRQLSFDLGAVHPSFGGKGSLETEPMSPSHDFQSGGTRKVPSPMTREHHGSRRRKKSRPALVETERRMKQKATVYARTIHKWIRLIAAAIKTGG